MRRYIPKRPLAAAGFVCAGGAFFFFASALLVHYRASAQVAVQPFVAEIENYSIDASSGSRRFASKKLIARRSDGSSVEVQPFAHPKWGQTARTIRFASGRSVVIVDAVAAKAVRTEPALVVAALKTRTMNPPRNCESTPNTALRSEPVLGHRFSVVKHQSPAWDSTLWMAEDLGCTVLQSQMEERDLDGKLRLSNETRLVSLQLREPDADLFDERPAYDVLPPSKLQLRFLEKMGIPVTDALRNEGERADKGFLGGQ